MKDLKSRFEGALLGCAIGDALGAPFEGLWGNLIPDKDELLSDFALFEGYPKGQFTDDTQLTVATVEAILIEGEVSPAAIAREIGKLWRTAKVIGPGGACMEAGDNYLRTGNWQTCGAPPGSAGNGTAMRTGILGLCFLKDPENLIPTVANISKITHRDPRSIAGGVGIAQLTHSLVTQENWSPQQHIEKVALAMGNFHSEFADLAFSLRELIGKPWESVGEAIAWPEKGSKEFNQPIITPYILPTVLASLWCIFRHPDSWSEAVAKAIGLGGDVDTLGAIVGTVMGAKLGVDSLPPHLQAKVQQAEKLRVLARRLGILFG